MAEQLADRVLVGRRVGGAGQRQDLVRAAGREQRRRHPQRVGDDDVVVGYPPGQGQRPGRGGGRGEGGRAVVRVRVRGRGPEGLLPPVRVVQALIVRRGAGDRGVEHLR